MITSFLVGSVFGAIMVTYSVKGQLDDNELEIAILKSKYKVYKARYSNLLNK